MTQSNLSQLMRRGTDFLGCETAIMCGAMSWVSERNLVSAISNAGGYGPSATRFGSCVIPTMSFPISCSFPASPLSVFENESCRSDSRRVCSLRCSARFQGKNPLSTSLAIFRYSLSFRSLSRLRISLRSKICNVRQTSKTYLLFQLNLVKLLLCLLVYFS